LSSAQLDLALRKDVRADMAKVQAPALILAPADRFVDPAHSRELAAGIPGAGPSTYRAATWRSSRTTARSRPCCKNSCRYLDAISCVI
jgi:hypothetical protein